MSKCRTHVKNVLLSVIFSVQAIAGVEQDLLHLSDELSPLPEKVWVKSARHARDSEFEYALHQGKLYYRRRDDVDFSIPREWALPLIPHTIALPNKKMVPVPAGNDWVLFAGDGLPDLTHHQERGPLVKVVADADEVVVYDQDGRGWWMRNRTSFMKWPMGLWLDSFGQPQDVPFVIARELWPAPSLALGRRNEDVLYFDDAAGHQHHWGTFPISTHYLLSADRRHIFLLDPGVPLDYRYELCPPGRSGKVIKALDASSATMMAMDEDGQIFTKLEDFDTNGMDSMLFDYSYDQPDEKRLPKGEIAYSRWRTYYLEQSESWRTHPWNLPAGAKISHFISIFTTGKGNDQRELRVVGKIEHGEVGVYLKMLNDPFWHFRKVQLLVDESVFFNPEVDNKNSMENTNFENTYRGEITWDGQEYAMEVSGLHPGCSDAKLKLSYAGKSFKFKLFHDQAYTQMNLRDFPMAHPYLALATIRPDSLENSESLGQLPLWKDQLQQDAKEMFSWRMIVEGPQIHLYPADRLDDVVSLNEVNRRTGGLGHYLSLSRDNYSLQSDFLQGLEKHQKIGHIVGAVLSLAPMKQYRLMGRMIPAHMDFYQQAYQWLYFDRDHALP